MASSMALSLASCGMEQGGGADGPTECETLGATINPTLESAGYVIKLSLTEVGDNSVTGDIVDYLEVEDEDVCERFNDRGVKPLHIHSNYNKETWIGSERVQVCYVSDRDEYIEFPDAREQLEAMVAAQPGLEVTVTGHNRKSYTSDNDYEKRDVCLQIKLPPR